MSKALEAAARAVVGYWKADEIAKAAILAYLRALAEEGISDAMYEAVAPKFLGPASDHNHARIYWNAMLRAHIKEMEAGK